jgi:hypothetical protein
MVNTIGLLNEQSVAYGAMIAIGIMTFLAFQSLHQPMKVENNG